MLVVAVSRLLSDGSNVVWYKFYVYLFMITVGYKDMGVTSALYRESIAMDLQ